MKKDRQYYIRLTDKYFDATITPRQEEELRAFLASDGAADNYFDSAKAVLGYFAVQKTRHPLQQSAQSVHGPANNIRYITTLAMAACLLLFFGIQLYIDRNNVCISYVYGKKYTDKEMIAKDVENTLASLFAEDATDIAGQLKDIIK